MLVQGYELAAFRAHCILGQAFSWLLDQELGKHQTRTAQCKLVAKPPCYKHLIVN